MKATNVRTSTIATSSALPASPIIMIRKIAANAGGNIFSTFAALCKYSTKPAYETNTKIKRLATVSGSISIPANSC